MNPPLGAPLRAFAQRDCQRVPGLDAQVFFDLQRRVMALFFIPLEPLVIGATVQFAIGALLIPAMLIGTGQRDSQFPGLIVSIKLVKCRLNRSYIAIYEPDDIPDRAMFYKLILI